MEVQKAAERQKKKRLFRMGWKEREKIGRDVLEELAYEYILERQDMNRQRWVGRTVHAQRTTKAKPHQAIDKVQRGKSFESMVSPHMHQAQEDMSAVLRQMGRHSIITTEVLDMLLVWTLQAKGTIA